MHTEDLQLAKIINRTILLLAFKEIIYFKYAREATYFILMTQNVNSPMYSESIQFSSTLLVEIHINVIF